MAHRITDLPERIQKKIMPSSDGCWLWTGALNKKGYGQMWDAAERRLRGAHQVVYESLVGPITEETLDHLCRVRSCVNPRHLEPVSMRVNILRGRSVSAVNAAKTHCNSGHLYDEANTYMYRGWRYCRACQRQRASERPAKNEEEK